MPEKRRSAPGVAAIALAAAMWGVSANASRHLFDNGTDPFELAEARIFVTALGLAPLVLAASSRPETGLVRAKVFWLGVVIALVIATYHLAILNLPVAVAIVVIYTNPALVVAWSAVRSRRLPPLGVMAALVAALVGVALVSGFPGGELESLRWTGVASALAAAVLFAAFTVLAERAGSSHGPLQAMAGGFVVASLLWLLYQATQGWPATILQRESLPLTAFVSVCGGLLPFPLFGWGVQAVRADRAAIAATLQPPVAAAVAWIWLGQALTPAQITGGILVVGAVASLPIRIRHKRRKHDDPPA